MHLDLVDSVEIDKSEVLKFLGYAKRRVPPPIDKIIDEEIEKVNDLIDINVFVREICPEEALSREAFKGKFINECFDESQKAYVALYTIGPRLDERIGEYISSSDMMRGMALDKVGVVALDFIKYNIARYLERINPGLCVTNEVYPGERDFPVDNQKFIYEPLRNDIISINEYNQMTPIKSVAILMFLEDSPRELRNRCEFCQNKCH